MLFYKRIKSMEESLNKILIEGDFKEFEDDRQMRCRARLWDMFEGYYGDLHNTGSMNGKFLARPVFKNLLRSLVDEISLRVHALSIESSLREGSTL